MALLDQLLRAGGVSPAQVQRALEVVGGTLLQQGNQAGREILRRVNPQLEQAIDTSRQQGASRAIRQFEQNQAGRRAAQGGRPAPVPQFGGGGGRPPARPTASPAPTAPSVSRQQRLDLRNPAGSRALVPFTTSRGAVRPAGTSLGGTPYSSGPYNVPPRTEFLTRGGRVETFTPGTGPSVADEIEQALSPKFDFTQQNLYINPFRDPLSLMTRGGRVATFTPGTGPSVADEIQQALAGTSVSRNLGVQPSARPGQVSPDALGLQEPMGPLSRQLLESDPQTYKSISDLAAAAQRHFNVPVTVEDLVGPRGTSILNELQAGSAIVRSPGGRGGSPYAPRVEVILDPDPSDVISARPVPGVNLYPEASDVIRTAPGSYQLPPAGVDLLSDATDLRNAVGGLRQRDLGRYAMPAALGLAGGLGTGMLGFLALREDTPPPGQQLTEEQLYPREYPPSSLVPDSDSRPYPPAEVGQSYAPTQGQTAAPGQMGAGTVTIRMNDSASNQRQATQNAAAGAGMFQPRPQDFRTPSEFYAAASAYARQPGVRESVAEQLAQQSERMGQIDMQAWARANPGLAYQLSLRNAPRDISQQTPNIQEGAVVTPLGENNANNMVGNTAEAVRVAEGAPSDLRDATDPRLAVSLRPMPKELQTFFNRPGFAGTTRLY